MITYTATTSLTIHPINFNYKYEESEEYRASAILTPALDKTSLVVVDSLIVGGVEAGRSRTSYLTRLVPPIRNTGPAA